MSGAGAGLSGSRAPWGALGSPWGRPQAFVVRLRRVQCWCAACSCWALPEACVGASRRRRCLAMQPGAQPRPSPPAPPNYTTAVAASTQPSGAAAGPQLLPPLPLAAPCALLVPKGFEFREGAPLWDGVVIGRFLGAGVQVRAGAPPPAAPRCACWRLLRCILVGAGARRLCRGPLADSWGTHMAGSINPCCRRGCLS